MARDLYRRGPSKEELDSLAVMGLMPEDLNLDEEVLMWPEHADAAQVFAVMGSQWNRDFNGNRIGLKYETLPTVMDFLGIQHAVRQEMFLELRTMEREVLIMDREEN